MGILLIALTLILAFVNGANDVSKGIATLVGSGVMRFRATVAWGTLWTTLGAVSAAFASQGLVAAFSGKGLLVQPTQDPRFLAAVSVGAILWVAFANATCLPVSTTHALTGALFGAGLFAAGAGGLNWAALVEKSLTTPESYPLTLNSLVLACNQKTSREPVMNLEEQAAAQGLHALIERSLAGRIHEPGSRVPKFMHHAEIMLEGADAKTIATVCVLLLRGAQTAGEIKTRTNRLCEFASVAEVESLLQSLAQRPEPWVVKLSRQPGQKETRYRQLFSGPPAEAAATPLAPAPAPAAAIAVDRLSDLEKRVAAIEAVIERIRPT